MNRNNFNNWWEHPAEDSRFRGLLRISWGISTAHDLASGQKDILDDIEGDPESYPLMAPLDLATEMEAAAQRIREMTKEEPL